jgi:AraC-like DNA-binding protein
VTHRSRALGLIDQFAPGGLFAAADCLVRQHGPQATLREIACEAGIELRDTSGSPKVGSLIASLLEQRLGDVIQFLPDLMRPEADGSGRVSWSAAVGGILSAQLGAKPPSLQTVARTLAVGPRTLQRRLAEEGTSWRAELDHARCDRAAELLRHGFTHDVTAARVGYSGSRALRRALRRWEANSQTTAIHQQRALPNGRARQVIVG